MFQKQLGLVAGHVLVGALLTACHKNDSSPSLPAETTSGANKSGCLVEGRVLLPRDAGGRSGTNLGFRLGTTAGTSNFTLGISDLQDPNAPFTVEITADSLLLEEGKTYPFSISSHQGVVQGHCVGGSRYDTQGPSSGTLTITRLDRPAQLLAGQFEFVATDKQTGRQVRVTQGRFDYQH
jgi:hypothetical protein